MQWSFVAVGPLRADVEVPAGAIDIQPVVDGAVEVTLEARNRGSRKATELIERAEVSLEGDRLHVHVPGKPFRQADILCTVTLPDASSLRVNTASADVTCTVDLGSFAGHTASGDVELRDVAGDVELSAASGDLRCADVGGRLKVKGASTRVSVRRTGGEVDISLASGRVSIDTVEGSLRLGTASGDVTLGEVRSGKVTASSASGDFSIGVAKGVAAHLDVSSVSGEVVCDLPFDEAAAVAAGLRIKCNTVSGDVRIHSAS